MAVKLLAGRGRPTLPQPVVSAAVSKRTTKRKIRSKKKASHGKRPNAGRG